MPNELNIALATTGLTVTAQRYQNGAAVGSAISCPETGSTGFYSGNMTGTAGTYQLAFLAAGANVGAGSIIWDGTNEIATSTLTAPQVRTELSTELGRIDANISSRLAPSGTLATVTTLTNAPTVPSAAQIASQVRTELATELARVDVATSTRLAAADYNAPTSAPTAASVANAVWSAAARTITGGTVDTLTNAPTVPSAAAIATQVWAVADKTGYSLTSAERSAIAAAVEASILNEGDGQAILNAIVTAIGNSNVDQVALVAAIRSDLERNGGKLDGVPAAVRSNLATELGRIDAATSTRLAGSAYTAPANSDIAAIKAKTDALPASPAATGDIPSANIAAIKAKTDLLNTDRLAQVSTVSTTGAQLAAALS